jgi:HSP20 family protein
MKTNKPQKANHGVRPYSLRDAISKMIDDSIWHPFSNEFDEGWTTPSYPRLDIKETKNDIKVTAEIPGIDDPEKINIEVEGDYMKISGNQEKEEVQKDENVYREERSYGEFKREFVLPCDVDSEKVKARIKDGLLHITLPKTEKVKAKKIKIDKE